MPINDYGILSMPSARYLGTQIWEPYQGKAIHGKVILGYGLSHSRDMRNHVFKTVHKRRRLRKARRFYPIFQVRCGNGREIETSDPAY